MQCPYYVAGYVTDAKLYLEFVALPSGATNGH